MNAVELHITILMAVATNNSFGKIVAAKDVARGKLITKTAMVAICYPIVKFCAGNAID